MESLCGWYAVVLMCLTPSVVLSSDQSEEVNWAPRSKVRLPGIPNLAIHPRMRAFAHEAAEMSASGTASGHRNHLSTLSLIHI